MQITASARVNVLEKQGAFPLLGRYAVGFQIVLCLAQYLAFIAVCQLTRRIGDGDPDSALDFDPHLGSQVVDFSR